MYASGMSFMLKHSSKSKIYLTPCTLVLVIPGFLEYEVPRNACREHPGGKIVAVFTLPTRGASVKVIKDMVMPANGLRDHMTTTMPVADEECTGTINGGTGNLIRNKRALGAIAGPALSVAVGSLLGAATALGLVSAVHSGSCGEFGCQKGYCWAYCGVSLVGGEWCYTANRTKSQSYDYKKCKSRTDCDHCWPCAGPCAIF